MKRTLLLLLFLFFLLGSKAQEVVSSAGETNVINSVTLSWTLGELVTETGFRAEGESSLTQGFQQGRLSVTAIHETETNRTQFTVLPNPTSDFINLAVKEFEGLEYQLFDLYSKLLVKEKLQDMNTKIDLTAYPAGSYLLLIIKNNQKSESYQIIKTK
jgi:hypothetical protein